MDIALYVDVKSVVIAQLLDNILVFFCNISLCVNVCGGSFSLYMCQPGSIGFAERLSERFFLMTQDVESPCQAFSLKQCTSPEGQGNLFVKGLDLDSRPLVSDA